MKIEYTKITLEVNELAGWKWLLILAFPWIRPVRLVAHHWLREQAAAQGDEDPGSPRLSDVKFPRWRTVVFVFGEPAT